MRSIWISHPYLLFPVAKAAPKRLLTLFPEENREQILHELLHIAQTKYGVKPTFTVQLIVVSGILQWNYEVQIYVDK